LIFAVKEHAKKTEADAKDAEISAKKVFDDIRKATDE